MNKKNRIKFLRSIVSYLFQFQYKDNFYIYIIMIFSKINHKQHHISYLFYYLDNFDSKAT